MNDTKDKVKFLESLKRHFDQLYSVDSTPSSIINTAIPGLANSVKQMDSISRYYSRAGFLGLMFTKVGAFSQCLAAFSLAGGRRLNCLLLF